MKTSARSLSVVALTSILASAPTQASILDKLAGTYRNHGISTNDLEAKYHVAIEATDLLRIRGIDATTAEVSLSHRRSIAKPGCGLRGMADVVGDTLVHTHITKSKRVCRLEIRIKNNVVVFSDEHHACWDSAYDLSGEKCEFLESRKFSKMNFTLNARQKPDGNYATVLQPPAGVEHLCFGRKSAYDSRKKTNPDLASIDVMYTNTPTYPHAANLVVSLMQDELMLSIDGLLSNSLPPIFEGLGSYTPSKNAENALKTRINDKKGIFTLHNQSDGSALWELNTAISIPEYGKGTKVLSLKANSDPKRLTRLFPKVCDVDEIQLYD